MAAHLQSRWQIGNMQNIPAIIGFIILGLVILYFIQKRRSRVVVVPDAELPEENQSFLQKRVEFYQQLSAEEQKVFEEKVNIFLANVRLTGVKTEVTEEDKLMVAAAAIIPIFRFKDWQYRNLHEVLLYPNQFSDKFALDGDERNILGMVGEGAMQNVMVLSLPALRHGFGQHKQPTNTGIHEFVHLLDKSDGATDGLPENLMPGETYQPWLRWMHKEIAAIKNNNSEIDFYGATNEAEFFAVVSEYFFTQPEKLEEKHPELYALLTKIFRTEEPVATV